MGGIAEKQQRKKRRGSGNPSQLGAGLYSNTENVQSAIITQVATCLYT